MKERRNARTGASKKLINRYCLLLILDLRSRDKKIHACLMRPGILRPETGGSLMD